MKIFCVYWTTGTEGIPFEGTYEGNDYYILGLRPTSYVSGVFGVIGSNGVVSNVAVIDFDYESIGDMASGFAGINRGTMIGCKSGVNISNAATTFLYGSDEPVAISSLDSEINASNIASGLVAINEGTILNCHSSANVTIVEETDTDSDEISFAGGITAINEGTIQNVYQSGVISGADTAGGIAAINNGTLQYGYNNKALEAASADSKVGSIVGESNNTNISDFWFADSMKKACGNLENSEIQVTPIELQEMRKSTFADTLNAAIEGQGLAAWTQSSDKNEGYPRLESSVVVQRTLTSTSGNVSISGRIHPDATVKLVKLNGDDVEFKLLREALKSGEIEEGWKLALVYEDGTYAIWEGDLTVKIKPEVKEYLNELAVIYYDANRKYVRPDVQVEEDALVMTVSENGSFAVVKADDIDMTEDDNVNIPDSENDNVNDSNHKDDVNTGDSNRISIYVMLLLISVCGIAVILKKRGCSK